MALINTQIKPFKANAFKDGELIEVSSEDIAGKWAVFVFYPADFTFVCPTELGDIAEALGAGGSTFGAADFRDRTKIGRNLAIEILEYFDKVGLTWRTGDTRKVLKPATEVFGDLATS